MKDGRLALVVDDNATARDLVRTLLVHRGLGVVEADDGVTGLEAAMIHDPNLIISDILMPTMDGYEFVRRLREAGGPAVPIIFYTATYHEPAAVELAARAGARVVYKDGDIGHLLEAIDASLGEVSTSAGGAPPSASDGEERSFHEDHVRLLTGKLMTQNRALAIAQVRLSALLRLSETIASETAPPGVLAATALAARDLLSSGIAGAVTFAPSGEPQHVATSGLDAAAKARLMEAAAGWEALRRPAEEGTTLSHDDTPGGPDLPVGLPSGFALLAVPIAGMGSDHGTVFAIGSPLHGGFDGEDAEVLTALARHAGVGLDRARIHAEFEHAQRMESIGRLTGGIAHDFNNLLTAIIGFSDLLVDTFDVGDVRRSDMQAIRDAAHRASGLTGQLLAFSRRQVLVPRIVDLAEALDSAANLLRRVVGEDVIVSLAVGTTPIPVLVDPSHFDQVIMNLAVNARDAMPNGGTLALAARVDRGPPGEPGTAVLTVADSGTGMSQATQARMFEAFFTTKPEGQGTGLGLSTVHSAVAAWNGAIEVASEPGTGTTFTIRIPLVDASAQAPSSASVVARDTGSEPILVIEDDPHVRELMSETLGRAGYRVTTAASLGEVRQWFDDGLEIELVISDLILPDGTGIDVAKVVRAERPRSAIVLTSGYADRTILDDAFVLHSAFLPKPFSPVELRRAARLALDSRIR